MSVDLIKASIPVMQSPQTLNDISPGVSPVLTPVVNPGVQIIRLLQLICPLFIIIGLIAGILYMIKSKKTEGKKNLIGVIIIVTPFILYFILTIISLYMTVNIVL